MTDVTPKPSGFRRKFGFGRDKTAAARKLKKKNDGRIESDLDSLDSRETKNSDRNDSLQSPIDGRSSSFSSTISKTSSAFAPWKTSTQDQPQAPLSKKPLQKLQKPSTQTSAAPVELDKDTGERKDLTEMMHAFGFSEHSDSSEETASLEKWEYDPSKLDGASLLGRLYPELWKLVGDYLSPLEIANLASTCHVMHHRLGHRSYELLRNPLHLSHRLEFLSALDSKLPYHLFCFACAQWHIRISPGSEKLKPPNVLNPVFSCPNSTNNLLPQPRLRISDHRYLPFTFVQLYKRAWEHGPSYGIQADAISRRWKDIDSGWSHESMFHINSNGHVMMRVKSRVFVEGGLQPAAKRMLLFSRSDYTPYFSVCAHWRKGLLTSIPKCALDHIPVHKINNIYLDTVNNLRQQRKIAGPTALCGICQPMRRCPLCPTEYLFELKLVEDRGVKSNGLDRFRQSLLVTRWSDLGPARSPLDPEWASLVGEYDGYNSFEEIGKRALSGIFESAFTDTTPGQRILSMNPEGLDADEDGGDWY